MTTSVLAQLGGNDAAQSAAVAAASTVPMLVVLAIFVLLIAATWKVFERAGEPGWAALVPIYNLIVLCRVAGVSGWWVLAAFIPLLNIIFVFVTSIGVAERFGKGTGYGIGLVLLPFIFWPMLAWSDAQPVARMA